MKIRKAFTLLTAAALLTLTACAEAPEEVKRENEILNEATGDNEQTELKFATLQEIRAEVLEVNKNNSTNVQVGVVRVGEGDAMPAYKANTVVENYDKLSDMVSFLYGEELESNKDRMTVYPNEDEYGDAECKGAVVYVAEGHDEFTSIISHNCGVFGVSDGNSEYRFANTYPLVKTYSFYLGDECGDDSYTMSDGAELKVSDAVKSVESFYNTYVSPLEENEFIYKVKELTVHQYDDGTHGFAYDMEYTDKSGNLFSCCVKTIEDLDGFEEERAPIALEQDVHGFVIDSKMSVYAYKQFSSKKGETIDDGTRLLTYESALDVVSKRLATSSMYDMDVASLVYVMVAPPEAGVLIRNTKDNSLLHLNEYEYIHDPDHTPEVRPYWQFIDLDKNGTSEAVLGGCVLVDALTGEVYVC